MKLENTDKNRCSSFTNIEKNRSAQLCMSIFQKEYEAENNRKQNLNTRAGIIISLISVFMLFLMNNVVSILLLFDCYLVKLIIICLFIIMMMTLFFAVRFCIKAISISTYKRLSLNDCFEDIQLPERIFARKIANLYKYSVAINRRVNNSKYKYLGKAFCMINISVTILLIIFIVIILSKIMEVMSNV